jgi:D-inositol-3-phosphate glycosyltransferase
MKIALVTKDSAARVAELSHALERRGHDVSMITPPARSDDELLASIGPFAQHLDTLWSSDRPDVVHAHCWMSGMASLLATRRLGLPAVQTFHGLRKLPQELSHLEAMVAKTANWVTATSTDEVFELIRMGRPRGRISVVTSGVDTDVFTPLGVAAAKDAEHRIVAAGKLAPHNGFDTLVRAMPMVPKAELVIAGDPVDSRLPDLAKELGVARRVHLCGTVSRTDMPELLRSADVVACTPRHAPTGAVALEAMACGVPVVAAATGALVDAVVNDVTGYLVPPNDPRGLANAINGLLRDRFLRQSLGAAGRDRAVARYSWDRIAEDTQRMYERLTGADTTTLPA